MGKDFILANSIFLHTCCQSTMWPRFVICYLGNGFDRRLQILHGRPLVAGKPNMVLWVCQILAWWPKSLLFKIVIHVLEIDCQEGFRLRLRVKCFQARAKKNNLSKETFFNMLSWNVLSFSSLIKQIRWQHIWPMVFIGLGLGLRFFDIFARTFFLLLLLLPNEYYATKSSGKCLLFIYR